MYSAAELIMNNLINLSSDKVREHFNLFKDYIIYKEDVYDLLWNGWYAKFRLDKNHRVAKSLRNFIMNDHFHTGIQVSNNPRDVKPLKNGLYIIQENVKTLIIKGLDEGKGKMMRTLCDQIGFHYYSNL